MVRTRLGAVLAMGATVGLGATLGIAIAGSSSMRTRTVTLAATISGPARTVTQVRTIERVRTKVKTVAVPGPAVQVGGVPATGQAPSSPGPRRPQQFSGSDLRVLGTITVPEPGATLRWTNSAGRFRLLFNGTGVAVDSTAHSGQIAAPPLTYQQVTVNTKGRWTIRIG
jgi:hypothetical protein